MPDNPTRRMAQKPGIKFSTVRMQLVASVFLWISPALVLTFLVNQKWFWDYAPDWMRPYAIDLSWISFIMGFLALMAAWFGGEHYILRQIRDLSKAVDQISKGDLKTRTG